MLSKIATEYEFCSAHFLPKVPDTHKCKRLHGHNYRLRVLLQGPPRPDGMLMDFFDIDAVVKPLVDQIDHRCLNDIPGLENPTAELIAEWFATKIAQELNRLVVCRVYETPTCYAEVSYMVGDDGNWFPDEEE